MDALASPDERGAPAVLLVRAAGYTCALDLSHVVEIMRPLPVAPIPGAPDVVIGLSRTRDMPTPVVSLSALLGGSSAGATRFVLSRTGARRVALSVDAVLGIVRIPSIRFDDLPPLLRDVAEGSVQAIAARDRDLLLILNTAVIVPQEVWQLMEARTPDVILP